MKNPKETMKKILDLKISAINIDRNMQTTKLLSISVKSKTYKRLFITAPKCSFHLEVNKPDKSLNPMKKSCEIFLENRGTYTNGELTHTLETNIIDRVTQMNLCIPCCRYFCEVVLYNAVFSYDFLTIFFYKN